MKSLYWICNKCGFLFTSDDGIPFQCPSCGSPHYMRGIQKKTYDSWSTQQELAYEYYQHKFKDYTSGCYGRFLAWYTNLPSVDEDAPFDPYSALLEVRQGAD